MNMPATAGALMLATAGAALGAPLVDLIQETRDGTVRFSYQAREGVWGDGENRIFTDSWRTDRDWCRGCEPGPVRVELELERGRVVDLEGRVGGRWRGAADVDLGAVDAPEAAAYLLRLAREAGPAVGQEAVALAPLAADAVLWAELRDLALDRSVAHDVREDAVFWISQYPGSQSLAAVRQVLDEAGDEDIQKQAVFALSQHEDADAATALEAVALDRARPEGVREAAVFWLSQVPDVRALDALDRVYREVSDPDLREQVIFAYSQREEERALDRLLHIAGHDADSGLREKALFWLGQSDDPRAIAWIEQLILN